MLQRILPIMLRSLGAFFASVATLAAQSYSPMYNPQSTNAQSWVCIDQYGQRIPYAYFYFYTGTYLNTNAHFHDDPSHPWSSATCTTTSSYQCLSATDVYAGPDGVFSLQINTTLIGQAEVLVITCSSGGGSVSGALNYAVGYNDLVYNDDPNVYVKIGGTDTGANTGHGSTAYNRYMQNTPSWQIWYATLDYLAAHPEISKVCLNDQALQYGGKFDSCALGGCPNPPYPNPVRPWISPHESHDRGTAADVAGIGSGQCANYGGSGVNVAEFIDRCVDHGAVRANSISEGNHAHCQFGDINAWPH